MSVINGVDYSNHEIDSKQIKENKKSLIDTTVTRIVKDRIASFIQNSQSISKGIEEYGISQSNFDLLALQRMMTSLKHRHDSILKSSIEGMDACIKKGGFSQAYRHLNFLLREIEITSDRSLRRLINVIIHCCKHHLNASLLMGINDLINGSILEGSQKYDDFTLEFKSWLKMTIREIRDENKRGLYEVTSNGTYLITIADILNAFDESYEAMIKALKKIQSLNNSVENSRHRLENLIKKIGIEKTMQVYQYLIQQSQQMSYQQYHIKPLVLGMIKACGAEKYFRDFSFTLDPKQHSDIDFSYNFRLTESGMELILSELKKKNPALNQLPAKVCISFDDLKNEVKRMVEKGQERQFFFVRTQAMGFHMSSVYLEKHSLFGYRVVIVDSVNKEKNYAVGHIRKVLPLDCSLTVYYADILRQNDHVNCPVFCIRDFTQFAQASTEIMEYITNSDKSHLSPIDVDLLIHSDSQINDDEILKITAYRFSALPARMMKLTQSLDSIIEYEKRHQVSVKLKIHHLAEKWIKINGRKEKKMMNVKINHVAWKYHLLILKKCFQDNFS